MVVIDEAYFEFSGVTVIPWIRRYKNLIVTRTFSKTAGLAGLRLGCIFVHRELAAVMRKAQSPYPVNAAALVAGEAAMRDRAFIARTVREVRRGRRELERGLARLGVRCFPSGGNFVLVHFGDRAKEIVAALDAQRNSGARPFERFWRRGLRPRSRWAHSIRRGVCCASWKQFYEKSEPAQNDKGNGHSACA